MIKEHYRAIFKIFYHEHLTIDIAGHFHKHFIFLSLEHVVSFVKLLLFCDGCCRLWSLHWFNFFWLDYLNWLRCRNCFDFFNFFEFFLRFCDLIWPWYSNSFGFFFLFKCFLSSLSTSFDIKCHKTIGYFDYLVRKRASIVNI
jgi:hypothetical protein